MATDALESAIEALVDEERGEQPEQDDDDEEGEDEDEGGDDDEQREQQDGGDDMLLAAAAHSLEDALAAVQVEVDSAAAAADGSMAGLARWASAAFDGFVHQAETLLDVQQQQLAGAVEQHQQDTAADAGVMAATALPRRPCPRHEAMMAAAAAADAQAAGNSDDSAAALQQQGDAAAATLASLMMRGAPMMTVTVHNAPIVPQPLTFNLDEAVDAWSTVEDDGDDDDDSDDESAAWAAAFEDGTGDCVAQLMFLLLAAACAGTAAAMVRAGVQLRSSMAAADGYGRVDGDDAKLRSYDSISSDDLEGAYLIQADGDDLKKGSDQPRVLVVVARNGEPLAVAHDTAVQHYRNKLYSSVPTKDDEKP